jgi:aspartate aminotransferase-like enzyme
MSASVAALKFPESSAGNYFDFHSLHAHTIARPDASPYTQPSGIFRALHTALVELEGIGREAWFKRHRLGGTTCAVVPPEGLEFYEPGSSAQRRTG